MGPCCQVQPARLCCRRYKHCSKHPGSQPLQGKPPNTTRHQHWGYSCHQASLLPGVCWSTRHLLQGAACGAVVGCVAGVAPLTHFFFCGAVQHMHTCDPSTAGPAALMPMQPLACVDAHLSTCLLQGRMHTICKGACRQACMQVRADGVETCVIRQKAIKWTGCPTFASRSASWKYTLLRALKALQHNRAGVSGAYTTRMHDSCTNAAMSAAAVTVAAAACVLHFKLLR